MFVVMSLLLSVGIVGIVAALLLDAHRFSREDTEDTSEVAE